MLKGFKKSNPKKTKQEVDLQVDNTIKPYVKYQKPSPLSKSTNGQKDSDGNPYVFSLKGVTMHCIECRHVIQDHQRQGVSTGCRLCGCLKDCESIIKDNDKYKNEEFPNQNKDNENFDDNEDTVERFLHDDEFFDQ